MLNQFEQTPWFRRLHRWIIPRAKWFIWLIGLVSILLLLPIGVAALVYQQSLVDLYPWLNVIARQSGKVAVLFYVLTLIPGILRRLGILPLTRSILMLWRRYFGIAMFHAALTHQLLIRTMPLLFFNPRLLFINPGNHILWGLIATLLLFPLWLTSNDWSVRVIGRYWRWLHSLTHLAIGLIFFHVAFSGEASVAIWLGVVWLVDLISWLITLRQWLKPAPPAGLAEPGRVQ